MRHFYILLFSFLAFNAFAQSDITIQITNIHPATKGPVRVMLFNTSAGFPMEHQYACYSERLRQIPVQGRLSLPNIPAGTYALTAYVDLNNNDVPDRNLFGFPQEPITASNLKRLGKPSFNKCSFVHNGRDETALKLILLNQ